MSLVMVNSNEDFVREVENANGFVIAGFTADWCPHCKVLAPHIKEMADAHPEMKICRVDVDKAEQSSDKYEIMTIPTLAVFKDGKLVDKLMVAQKSMPEIMAFLQDKMK